MGNSIDDFKHISGREYDTPIWQIEQMISEWHDIKSEEFGGNVTKIKTKEEAQKNLKSYIVFEVDYNGAYAKKRKYLRKKFGILKLQSLGREAVFLCVQKKFSAVAKNFFFKLYGWAVYPASQILQMECVGNHFRPHITYIV